MADYTAIIQLDRHLDGMDRIAVGGHEHPDGDCAGSTTSLYRYIKKTHPLAQVDLYLQKIPDAYAYIADGIDVIDTVTGGEEPYDLFICLDCGDKDRLGFSAPVFERAEKTICIDHHISNPGFADVNRICPDASSTCEILTEEFDPEMIDQTIAEGLFLGIVHDTGVFQYSCTSPETHRIAARLLEKGFDAPGLISRTYYEKTFNQQMIDARAVLNARLLLDGQVIVSSITIDEMNECGVMYEHLDGIVSHLRETRGVECAVFLYERKNGLWKVSLRSREKVDVCQVAQELGGGGHKRAAGATLETADVREAVRQIAELIEKQL